MQGRTPEQIADYTPSKRKMLWERITPLECEILIALRPAREAEHKPTTSPAYHQIHDAKGSAAWQHSDFLPPSCGLCTDPAPERNGTAHTW